MNGKWVSVVCYVGALAIVTYFGVRTYGLFTAPTYSPTDPPVAQRPAPEPSRPGVDIQRLADFHLFGQPSIASPAKPAPALQSARPSTKSYRIAGVALSALPERSSVLFEVKPGDMGFYRVKDQVEPGVTVSNIQMDAVYLEVNQRLERIDVPAAKERLFQPVRQADVRSRVDEEYHWDWLDEWGELSDASVAEKLGLEWVDEVWVITQDSPFVSARQIEAGFALLSVNGEALTAKHVKRALLPVKEGQFAYLMMRTPSKRFSVKWKR